MEQLKGYTTALLLGVAYASSIGGCGTLIGKLFSLESYNFLNVRDWFEFGFCSTAENNVSKRT
jgi:hypothetical protein